MNKVIWGKAKIDTVITFNGETKTVSEWASLNDMTVRMLTNRLEIYSIKNAMNKNYKPTRRMKEQFKSVRRPHDWVMLSPPGALI